jgi:hypothetical protein
MTCMHSMAAGRAERRRSSAHESSAAFFVAAALALAGTSACSSDSPGEEPGNMGGTGGGAGTSSTGSANGGTAQGMPAAGSGGAGGAVSEGAGGSGTGGSASASPWANEGVCGQRGVESVVSASSFEGYEEFYLINDRGIGMDVCVVRFSVNRVGEAPAGCTDCAWSHRVAYSNPEVLTDVDGVCSTSELGMTAAKIAELDGSELSYGYVDEYAGHVSVLLKYEEASTTWEPNGNASWNAESGMFRFNKRSGSYCGY